MSSKKKEKVQVLSTAKLAEGIYEMWLETDMAQEKGAGRFIALYPKNKATLLPRPISICERDAERGALRIVYRVAGEGTKEFSSCQGGGIGIPPLLELAKELNALTCKVQIVLGYRDAQLFLRQDMEQYGKVYVATEDGSIGTRGNVLDAVRENGLRADMIYACGPMPMLKAIKKYAAEAKIPAWISLEERMACGVGACLGCVCKTVKEDAHSHVHNARICTDGPVFLAEDVDI